MARGHKSSPKSAHSRMMSVSSVKRLVTVFIDYTEETPKPQLVLIEREPLSEDPETNFWFTILEDTSPQEVAGGLRALVSVIRCVEGESRPPISIVQAHSKPYFMSQHFIETCTSLSVQLELID